MPIELITGKPGNFKTAFLVDRMLAEGEKPNPRPLVAFGINGLEPGIATTYTDPRRWSEITDRNQGDCTCPLYGGEPGPDGTYPPHTHLIPRGALIFVDEAWKWFGHLHDASRQATPRHVLDLAEHRHMGVDFIWTAQGPNQLYPFVRPLIADHEHLVRRWGTMFVDSFKWEELNEDVKSTTKRENALRATKAAPKNAFGKYKSAEEHTIKRNIPWRVVALPAILIAALAAGWLAFLKLQPSAVAQATGLEGPAAGSPAAADQPAWQAPESRADRWTTLADYAADHLPRFATMPWTAPVYDGRSVTVDPQLYCMASTSGLDANGEFKEEGCSCMTEQGTRYEISPGECRRVARYGTPYNPYKERQQDRQQHDRSRDPQPQYVSTTPIGRAPPPTFQGGAVGTVGAPGVAQEFGTLTRTP